MPFSESAVYFNHLLVGGGTAVTATRMSTKSLQQRNTETGLACQVQHEIAFMDSVNKAIAEWALWLLVSYWL